MKRSKNICVRNTGSNHYDLDSRWKVEYAPRAQEDLDEIFEYYATNQLDDSFAESLIVRLVKAADSLAEMPLRLYPEEPLQSVGVHDLLTTLQADKG